MRRCSGIVRAEASADALLSRGTQAMAALPQVSPSAPLPSPSAIRSANQVARLLRRLPVGRTLHTFFLNEVSHPVKAEFIAQLHLWRRTGRQEGKKGLSWLAGRRVLDLSAPTLGLLPERVMRQNWAATMNSARKLSRRSAAAAADGDTACAAGDRQLPGAHLRAALQAAVQPGPGSAGGVLLEPLVLVPCAEVARTTIGVHTRRGSDVARGDGALSMMLSTECTTPRANYMRNAELYVLGVPLELLEGKDARDVARLVQAQVLYDQHANLLLLASTLAPPACTGEDGNAVASGGAAPVTSAHGVFLSQMFSLDACSAYEAAVQTARGARRGARSPRYRLFFLCLHGTPGLWSPADAFPGVFTSYTVDIPTTTRLFSLAAVMGQASPPRGAATTFSALEKWVEPYAKAPLWTRLSLRRLTVKDPRPSGEGNLWSTQLSPSGDKNAKGRGATGRPASGSANHTARTSRQYLRAVDAALRQRSATHTLSDLPAEGSVAGSRAERGEGEASDAVQGPLHPRHAALLCKLFQSGESPALREPAHSTRGPHAAFHVFEVRPSAIAPALPLLSAVGDGSGSGGAALLEEAVRYALREGVPPFPSPGRSPADRQRRAVLVPTALDSSLAVREGVFRPFLLSDGVFGRGGRPPLWRLGQLERLSGWRRHHRRFGALGDVLGGWAAAQHIAAATFVGDSGGDGPLVLLRDRDFAERVLRPALAAYARAHFGVVVATAVSEADHNDTAADEKKVHMTKGRRKGSAVLLCRPLRPLGHAVELAVATHFHRLHRALSHAAEGTGASVAAPMASPFLAAVLSSTAPSPFSASPAAAAINGNHNSNLIKNLHVVPILPFLRWAAAGLSFTAKDLTTMLAYFSYFDECFDVLGGDRTTVAFVEQSPH